MKKYLITVDTETYKVFADSIQDVFVKVLGYFGCMRPSINKAFMAQDSVEDLMDMFNMFNTDNEIRFVMEFDKPLFDDEQLDEIK